MSKRFQGAWIAMCTCVFGACGSPPQAETDGSGEAPPWPSRAESCADAMELAPGARVTFSLADASADETLGCGAPDAPDRAYFIDVETDATLRVRIDTEDALAVAVYAGEACADEDAIVCAADALFDPRLSGPVEPGRYTIVVKGETREPAELLVDLLPAACEGDALDTIPLDGSFPGNPIAGDASTAAIDQDPNTPGRQGGPMILCPGDVDSFYFAHLGGFLTIDTEGAPYVLRPVEVDLDRVVNPYVPAIRREGRDVNYDTIKDDAPPGYYMIRLRDDASDPAAPREYTLTIAHGCSGDREDSPVPEIDDGTATFTGLSTRGRTYFVDREAETYSICREDTDAFLLAPVARGVIEVGLGNLEQLTTAVELQPNWPPGTEMPPAVAVDSERVFDAAGNKLVIPVDRLDGRYVVRIGLAAEQLTTLRYGMSLDFIYDPPPNVTCETALPLAPTEELQMLEGANAGAMSVLVGACNGDALAAPLRHGAEVFYTLDVSEPMNLELAVAGASIGWTGTASLYRLPDGLCPADVSTLVPVKADGADLGADEPSTLAACGPARVRATLQPGAYLVAVEGNAGNDMQQTTPREGTFTLSMQTFPEGFPPAAACVDPVAFTLPAAGASTTVPIPAPLPHELRASCGGNGDESVLTFTTDDTVTVTLRTAPPHDTVLSVHAGSCEGEEVACNDDRPGATMYESEVTFETRPGVPTYVRVDKFSPFTQTPDDAFIEVTVAP